VLNQVNKHFGALHVLQDIDLTIARGEVVVVIGPSGSGKSTLCRTINRLETVDTGAITIDGKPLPQEGKELARLRADVGMVFQSFNLFAHKTVLENVMLGQIKVRKADKTAAEASARRRTSTPRSSPAGSSNASRSHGRWRWTPRSCSSTSRRRPSTQR
jgi:glutamate transport system ATP-binding protein